MPREIIYRCGVCGQVTERIVAKLLIVKFRPDRTWAKGHYEAHADIGICCLIEVTKLATFTKRNRNRSLAMKDVAKKSKKKRASVASKEVNTHPGKKPEPQGAE